MVVKIMPAKNKVVTDASIATMLAAKKPWSEIVAACHVGNGRVSRVAKGTAVNESGHGGGSDPATINALKFYVGMFNRFSEAIVSHPEIMSHVLANEKKIEEAETICQHS